MSFKASPSPGSFLACSYSFGSTGINLHGFHLGMARVGEPYPTGGGTTRDCGARPWTCRPTPSSWRSAPRRRRGSRPRSPPWTPFPHTSDALPMFPGAPRDETQRSGWSSAAIICRAWGHRIVMTCPLSTSRSRRAISVDQAASAPSSTGLGRSFGYGRGSARLDNGLFDQGRDPDRECRALSQGTLDEDVAPH